jgi:hypothetical protein
VSFLFLGKASIMPATSKAAPKKSSPKAVPQKSNQSNNGKVIKYSDKSSGQPQLVPIFKEIKKMLARYEKGTLKLSGGSRGKVGLVSKKPVEILGRKRDETMVRRRIGTKRLCWILLYAGIWGTVVKEVDQTRIA